MCYSLMVNGLIKRSKDEKEIVRVLWISAELDRVFLINIFDKSWPYEDKLSDLNLLIYEKKVEIVSNEIFYRLIAESELSERDKNKRDKAFNTVMELYKNIGEPSIFITHKRNKIINKIIKKCGVSRRTIEDYTKRYWKRGMNPNSLLPDTYWC